MQDQVEGKDDGLAIHAYFNNPRGVALLSDGRIVVADYGNHLIRVISSPSVKTRTVVTIAGNKNGKRGRISSWTYFICKI